MTKIETPCQGVSIFIVYTEPPEKGKNQEIYPQSKFCVICARLRLQTNDK
jgi:hypothetical protein